MSLHGIGDRGIWGSIRSVQTSDGLGEETIAPTRWQECEKVVGGLDGVSPYVCCLSDTSVSVYVGYGEERDTCDPFCSSYFFLFAGTWGWQLFLLMLVS